MKLNIEYTHPTAQALSKLGNPIPLYALALQGHPFKEGGSIPLRNSITVNIFTGVKLSWDDPSIVAFISGVHNAYFPAITVLNAGKLITSNNQHQEIFLTVSAMSGELCVVDYGIKLAEVYFIKLADIAA